MQRGFKAWCENVSVQVRSELGLRSIDPLHFEVMAEFLNVPLWSSDDVAGLTHDARRILSEGSDNWSAITVSWSGRDAVIFNPTHLGGRRSSDVMHELAHLFIGHVPSTVLVTPERGLALRSFNGSQEEEANWLAWCLLLPRPAVLHIVSTRMGAEAACSHYRVSPDVLRFRTNVTGAGVQLRRRPGIVR